MASAGDKTQSPALSNIYWEHALSRRARHPSLLRPSTPSEAHPSKAGVLLKRVLKLMRDLIAHPRSPQILAALLSLRLLSPLIFSSLPPLLLTAASQSSLSLPPSLSNTHTFSGPSQPDLLSLARGAHYYLLEVMELP